MTTFAARRAASLATFGDSITYGTASSAPDLCWAHRLASTFGATLFNHGISGTVLQNSPDASGQPRPHNGVSRFRADLLGSDRADRIAILYGFNDARYVPAPQTLNLAGFIRDYRVIVTTLIAEGFAPSSICLGSPPHIPDAGFAVGENGFAGQTRDIFERHVKAVHAIANEFGTFYAPVNERMGNEGGDALISPDHVHPNDRGHAKIAEVFAEAERATP